ncbi:MAG: glycosyltransferase [Candidatus Brocadiia bacterium]
MKRVLIISYYFPPVGGSGVHRPWALARHLPAFGFEPVVLTAGMGWHGGAAARAEQGVPMPCRVVRTASERALPLYRLWKSRGRVTQAFARTPEPRLLWTCSALRTGRRLLSREHFDVVLATAPPYGVALAGRLLHLQTGVPLVLDFRDPWAFGVSNAWFGYAGWLLDTMAQGWAVGGRSQVVMNTPAAWEALADRNPFLAHRRATWIPNGFRDGPAPPQRRKSSDRMRMVHAGVFYGTRAPDGGKSLLRRVLRLLKYDPGQVDRTPQSVGFLLEALGQAVSRCPRLREELEVVLVGALARDDQQLIARCGLESMVTAPGYVPVEEAVSYIRSADLLYLPFWVSRAGRRIPRVPSKTYEYIAAGKPILGVLSEGDTRDIVSAAGTGLVCENMTVGALAAKLCEAYSAYKQGRLDKEPDGAYIEQFDWRVLTSRMAAVLNEAVESNEGES